MICIRCNSEKFDLKENSIFIQEYEERLLEVSTPGMVCHECGWETLGVGQLDAFLKATKKVYEKAVYDEKVSNQVISN